ncbi:hypothetical protein H112_06987 [Trichophyton rubrum D6]|uniref:Uncharacterized protein n=2 Tax=Trichophyton TaxID=5550 RepID=A0A022VT20_TRIRU|nr:hypothetical protein H100_07011 [Trichophyton rubrum MR850]EZF38783.1 hypothetical protein H102_06972 [Trichophyton rubrum CBS 100081]EZF49417.1 hypothetical protein H103_06996 [Trichophyton rubrum CBS 288.86]EZF60083.1 hypothetical protein H104_06950 [Trichophyton rubrum CBS 289.86]EZF70547.1 hypothetical protein H105_07009 [Trichophyton soudanense CBS 452.61]EZF81429.1 hypothetical protein H110_06991 [Trichophyton rubrum MR1448]EZG13560.1 hypothetical protein H107_07154 [Trichophyton rub
MDVCSQCPLPQPYFLCIQCGTDNACRCKIVGRTLGFWAAVLAAIVCYPAALFCGCCATEMGKKVQGTPVDINQSISRAIPF